MIEYQDGSFSEILDAQEALERMQEIFMGAEGQSGKEEPETATASAVHIGTKEELRGVKKKRSLEERLSDVEERLNEREKPTSKFLHLP